MMKQRQVTAPKRDVWATWFFHAEERICNLVCMAELANSQLVKFGELTEGEAPNSDDVESAAVHHLLEMVSDLRADYLEAHAAASAA